MRISDWSSDVCSSDRFSHELSPESSDALQKPAAEAAPAGVAEARAHSHVPRWCSPASRSWNSALVTSSRSSIGLSTRSLAPSRSRLAWLSRLRSEEHTSELQSLMRISYAVFCFLKKRRQPRSNRTDPLFPKPTLFRSHELSPESSDALQKPAAEAAPAGVAEARAHSHVPRWCSPASRSWNSALVTSSRSSIGLSTRSLAPSRSRLAWLSRLASPVITSTGRRRLP